MLDLTSACLMLGLTSTLEILFNVRPYFCLRDLV